MLIEQNIKFELRGPGTPGRTYTPKVCERGVQGVHRTRAQGARKSSGFRVKFWYRTITP